MIYVITSDCNQCGACEAGCETGAIKQGETQNTIDITICSECGECADICPFQAIVVETEVAAGR